VHPLIPDRPSIALVVAEIGTGKTSLLCNIVARAGKRVLYIAGEGHPKTDITPLIKAAGGDLELVRFVDCVVEHADAELDGLLSHKGVAPHLDWADCIIVDPLTAFESDNIKRHKIRRRLQQFHALTRKGVMVFIATHPNRTRRVRRPLDLVPSGWAGNVEIVWQIEQSDQLGHAVLEMTRGRHYAQPWKRYTFWIAPNAGGIPVAVIADEPCPSIADLLRESAPNYLPPSVAAAKRWLLGFVEHAAPLVETEIFPAGKAAGHSEPALVKAKAISKGEIGHTPQGAGPSRWFSIPPRGQVVDSVESVSNKNDEQVHQSGATTCPHVDVVAEDPPHTRHDE
jgi:hypothetical protein